MLVKFPRTLISQFSTVLSYTLLVSVNKVKSQTRTLVSTNVVCFLLHQNYFTSLRTSTVLGRFYYGISRHSTPVYFFTEICWRPLLYSLSYWVRWRSHALTSTYGIIRNLSSSGNDSSNTKKLCQQVINETKDNSNIKGKDLYRETRTITLSTSQGFIE